MSETEFLDYRQESKKGYSGPAKKNRDGKDCLNEEQLKLGALLRIADCLEKLADSFEFVAAQRDMYKSRYERELSLNKDLKLKLKQLKNANNEHSNK